jgi:hypothetical protein
MKARLIIAMAIGALISMIFLAVPSLRDGTSPWASLELPGIVAVLLVWGTQGGGGSDVLALGCCLGRECGRLRSSCLGSRQRSQNFKLRHYRKIGSASV